MLQSDKLMSIYIADPARPHAIKGFRSRTIHLGKIEVFLLDTRLPQSRAGGQELYLRSLDNLGGIKEAKDRKKQKQIV